MPSLEHLVKAQRLYYTSLNFNLSNVLIHSKAADTSWPQGVCVCVCEATCDHGNFPSQLEKHHYFIKSSG